MDENKHRDASIKLTPMIKALDNSTRFPTSHSHYAMAGSHKGKVLTFEKESKIMSVCS